VLVGRAREQGLLDDLVRETRAGRGGVVGLVGDAGIGKSALLDDLAARTEGLQVLRIHAVQSEARLPFAALFELLRPLLDLLPTVPAPQRDALEGALALRAGRSEDRFAIGAGTLALLSAAADRAPLLVLVDDAQWLDGSTADALRFAGRRLLADPVGTVVAARPDGRPFVDDLRGTVVELPGLDRAATAELLRDCTRDAVLLDHLHAGTGGNPLALRELDLQADELLRAPPSMPVPVGPRITAVYAARWAQLPEGVQDVVLLLAASDAGDLADLGRAASRAGLDLRLLDDAAAAGLVVVRSDRAAFCHRSSAPPSTALPRPTGVAPPTACWPPPCPTPTPTAGRGTSPWPRSVPTTPRHPPWRRPVTGRGSAAPTTRPGGRSSGRRR